MSRVGPGEQLAAWPDTVGIRRDCLSAHPEVATVKSTEYGPLAVFQRPE
ncbi:hypothetical protein [Streptomyces sp. NPDC001450]